MSARVLIRIGTIVAIAGSVAYFGRSFRRDRAAAIARLEAIDREMVVTPLGVVQYAVRGAGVPVLVSHGIFQGFDGGLLAARDLVPGHRVVAPSRFGYLGSALPPEATPADQADAFAALLDHLQIDLTDVIGISAGATAALQLALRHPDRVMHLVIVSGNLPGGTTAVVQPSWAKLFYADWPMWALKVFDWSLLIRLAGVPRGFPRSPGEDRFVAEFIDSLFPVGPRAEGIEFDAFVSNPDVNSYPLDRINVPTLFIHAKDDPLAPYDAARKAAERTPGAVLVTLESGGHLGLGQTESMRSAIDSFLSTPIPLTTRSKELSG